MFRKGDYMKRFGFIIYLTIVLASCCRKADEVVSLPKITATTENRSETRTSISVDESGTGTIYWNPSDQIDVFFGSTKTKYVSQNGSPAKKAVFKTNDHVSVSMLESAQIWGLFPSHERSTSDGSSVKTELPGNQYGLPNSFDDDLFITLAHSESTALQFFNVCSGIKFSLTRADIKSITFRGNAQEDLAGTIRLSFANGRPIASVINGIKEITLTPKEGEVFMQGVDYYIITLPTTLSKGFTVSFTTTENTVGTLDYRDASIQLNRSLFRTKRKIDMYADFGDDKDPVVRNYSFDWDSFSFTADGSGLSLVTTASGMERNVYGYYGMSPKEYHTIFDAFYPDYQYDSVANIGTVEELADSDSEGTHFLKWTITGDEAWEYAGEPIEHAISYVSSSPGKCTIIILSAEVNEIRKLYNVTIESYIRDNWNLAFTATRFNSAVPISDDTDSVHCVFQNDLNAPFVTWSSSDGAGSPGVIKTDPALTLIQYFFCQHEISVPKIEGKSVSFHVSDDGLTLYATLNGHTEMVASIDNDGYPIPNSILLNKESDIAKKLLNTCQLYVNIGAKGYYSYGDNFWEVGILFNGEDHFRADYVRPVNITDQPDNRFIDGVRLGEKGSYISIEDLFSPYDWQGHAFSEHDNYWSYYGPFTFLIDLDTIQCDLNGRLQSIPETLELRIMDPYELTSLVSGDIGLPGSQFGYLTYTNSGAAVGDFNLYINLNVSYGWGEIVSKNIRIPVIASTIPVATDLSKEETANCYIVNSAGQYKFNATVKGNSSASVGTPASASVVWETFNTSTTPSVGDVVSDVSYSDGYIYFTATGQSGNALVAVNDSNGVILWSWHIWITDYTPGTDYDTYVGYENLKVMDRNLGAMSDKPGHGSFGMVYQWGRKDPFLGSGFTGTSKNSGKSTTSTIGTDSYATQNPTVFIYGGDDWRYNSNSGAWASSKTDLDPCPAGWKVPEGGTSGLWKNFLISNSTTWSFDSVNEGMLFGSDFAYSDVWMPAQGFIGDSGYYWWQVGSEGRYWTTMVLDESLSEYFAIKTSTTEITHSYMHCSRANGEAVRCVEDK